MRITPRSRRGSLLLVVLSLLILFTMVGITFVLLAGQYKKAAQTAARHESVGDSPKKQLDGAMYQLLRGTENGRSALLGHSLLNDLYGVDVNRRRGYERDGLRLKVQSVTSIMDGQFLRLLSLHSSSPGRRIGVGHVLTMISGPCKGLSARVVNFIPQYSVPGQSYHEYIVETFDADIPINVADLVGNQFIVNGRAFNGAGSGIVSATGELGLYAMPERQGELADHITPPYQQRPRALLPNYAGSLFTVTGQTLQVRDPLEVEGQANRHTPRSNPYVSGADESYDAPDHQNMFLASIPANIMDTEVARSRIIPSFHRPALVNYWNAQDATWFANVFGSSPQSVVARHQVRPFIFRPMPWDHPNFSGSNPYFDRDASGATAATMLDALRGLAPDGSGLSPWDIDNDGDAIADSVWIDLGLPNQTTLDGRDYKPLFAILCVDLDGRLNINAHGSLAQLAQDLPPNSEGQFAGTVGSQDVFLPRGLGYGPADIDLSRFFDLPAPQSRAIAESLLRGRYGSDGSQGLAV